MLRLPLSARSSALCAILALSGALSLVRVSRPFDAHVEYSLSMYATFGRNYARFGYGAAGLAPVDAGGPSLEPYGGALNQAYTHRPPLVSLIISLPMRVFGAKEPVLRVTLAFAAVLTVWLFSCVAARALAPPWDLVATGLFAVVPIYSYFSVSTVHQVFALLGCLLVFLFYVRWRERSEPGRFRVFLAVAALAAWLDWPVYFAIGAVAVLHAVRGHEARRRAPLLLLPALVGLGGFVLYLFLLDPEGLLPIRSFLHSGSTHGRSAAGGAVGYLSGEARELLVHMTAPLLALALAGTALLRPRRGFADALILSTALLGLDELVFPSMCAWHDFLTLPLAVFAALAAARCLRFLWERKGGKPVAALAVLAFAIQSGAVLHKRWTFTGYVGVMKDLAVGVGRITRPGDRVLARLNVDPYLMSFYADRFVVSYREGALGRQYVNPGEEGISEDELIRRLSAGGSGFTCVVTASAERAAERFPWVAGLRQSPGFEPFVRRHYGFETASAPSKLVEFLRSRYRAEEHDGLLLFRLNRD